MVVATRGSARSRSTVRSATYGEPGTAVRHPPGADRGGDDALDDRGVGIFKHRRRQVRGVERLGPGTEVLLRGRVARGAQERRAAAKRGVSRARDVVGASGAEPDNHDARQPRIVRAPGGLAARRAGRSRDGERQRGTAQPLLAARVGGVTAAALPRRLSPGPARGVTIQVPDDFCQLP